MKKNNLIIIFMVFVLSTIVVADTSDTVVIGVDLLNQDPDPASSGDVVELRFGVENNGGKVAQDVQIELVPSYPFELVAGENAVKSIGTVGAYQDDENVKIIKYQVRVDKDASAGNYDIKLKYYPNNGEVAVTKEFTIVVEGQESAEIIHIDKTNLIPGKETPLKFTINNVGSSPLKDLSFKFENEDDIILPVGSDNTKYIKFVDVGDSAVIEYDVIADSEVEPGLYKLDLTLSYKDSSTNKITSINTIAGLYVGGETDFDVAFSESTGSEISFSVANIGSNPAYSVSVIVPKQDNWMTTGSNSVIIGNLDTGDYTVATYTLNSKSKQTSSDVAIQIAYTDTRGERLTVDKTVELNMGNLGNSSKMTGRYPSNVNGKSMTTKTSIPNSVYYLGGIVGALVVFGLWKKRKNKK